MEQRSVIAITDWVGLNTRLVDTEIPDGAASSINNIEFFREGFCVRNGITRIEYVGMGANPVNGLFSGYNGLIGYCGGLVFYYNGTNEPLIPGFTLIGSGLTSSAVPAFASYNGLDLFVNGSANDAPQKWDGGAAIAALGGSPPKADDIEVWRNHVFLTGLADPYQGEVRFSDQELPEVWPSGHFLRPTKKEKGAKLICAKVVPFPGEEDGTRLAVFAEDRIYHFDGFNKALFNVYTVQKGIGCVSKRSIVNAEGITYWVDENGIYASNNGGYSVNQISWQIQPTFDALDKSRLHLCCGVHFRYKRQIWWAFSNALTGYHDRVLVYNYGVSTPLVPSVSPDAIHVWSLYDLQLMAMSEYLTGGEYKVVGGSSTSNGYVYQLDYGSIDSFAAIQWHFKGKRHKMANYSGQAVLRRTNVSHELATGSISVSLYMDSDKAAREVQAMPLTGSGVVLGTFVLNTDYLGEGAGTDTATLWWNRVGHSFQYTLSGDTLAQLPRIYEMQTEFLVKAGNK